MLQGVTIHPVFRVLLGLSLGSSSFLHSSPAAAQSEVGATDAPVPGSVAPSDPAAGPEAQPENPHVEPTAAPNPAGAPRDGGAQPVLAMPPPNARPARKVELGLRLGYASPSGTAWEQSPLKDYVKGAVRAQLDASYSLSELLAGGVYLGFGLGSAGDKAQCDAGGASCSLFVLDIGFQLEAHPLRSSGVSPWVAATGGVDILSQHVNAGSASVTTSAYGPVLGAAAGVDLSLGQLALGPYLAYEAGWYTSIDVSTSDSSTSPDAEIEDKAMHRWLMVGVRGSYRLGG